MIVVYLHAPRVGYMAIEHLLHIGANLQNCNSALHVMMLVPDRMSVEYGQAGVGVIQTERI
jgi:hypothetical protein